MKKLILIFIAISISLSLQAQLIQVPIGGVTAYAGKETTLKDNNWLICDGRSLAVKQYVELFKVIGWTYGLGADSIGRTTFSIPNYQGEFLRGVSGNSGNDPDMALRVHHKGGYLVGDEVGSRQKDALQSHKHDDTGHTHETTATKAAGEVESDNSDERAAPPNSPRGEVLTGKANLTEPTDAGTGAGTPRLSKETRPKNVSVFWIIRVR